MRTDLGGVKAFSASGLLKAGAGFWRVADIHKTEAESCQLREQLSAELRLEFDIWAMVAAQ